MKTCSTCKFWDCSISKGQCRRHAPMPFEFDGKDVAERGSDWPVTRPKDWCGEYQPEEEAP